MSDSKGAAPATPTSTDAPEEVSQPDLHLRKSHGPLPDSLEVGRAASTGAAHLTNADSGAAPATPVKSENDLLRRIPQEMQITIATEGTDHLSTAALAQLCVILSIDALPEGRPILCAALATAATRLEVRSGAAPATEKPTGWRYRRRFVDGSIGPWCFDEADPFPSSRAAEIGFEKEPLYLHPSAPSSPEKIP